MTACYTWNRMTATSSASPESVASGDGDLRIPVSQARISRSSDLHSTTCTHARPPESPSPPSPVPLRTRSAWNIYGFVAPQPGVQRNNVRAGSGVALALPQWDCRSRFVILPAMKRNALVGTFLFAALLSAQGRRPGAFTQEAFRFRAMGPAVGNRIAAAAGVPGDATTYYVGAASGGVWKSTNSGTTWAPIFDNQPVAAIGALAVAPSDRKIVWAGTAEAWVIPDNDMMANSIYKSVY